MKPINRILLFFVLPLLATLLYPPSWLGNGIGVVIFGVVFFAALAFFLWRGYSRALTLMIFIQGINVIARMMMFFSNAKPPDSPLDMAYAITNLLGLALSTYLLLRLDKPDVRVQMIA